MELQKIFVLSLVLLITGYSYSKAEGPLTCTVRSNKEIFKTDEAIILEASIVNNTRQESYFIDYRKYCAPYGSAKPVIINKEGKEIRISWPVPAVYPPFPGNVNVIKIPPNEKWDTEINLMPDNLEVESENSSIRIPPGKYQIKIEFSPPTLGSISNIPFGLRLPFGLSELKEMNVKFWSGKIESNIISIELIK